VAGLCPVPRPAVGPYVLPRPPSCGQRRGENKGREMKGQRERMNRRKRNRKIRGQHPKKF